MSRIGTCGTKHVGITEEAGFNVTSALVECLGDSVSTGSSAVMGGGGRISSRGVRKRLWGKREMDGRGLLGKFAAASSKGRLRLSAFVFTYADKGRDPGLLHGLDMERGGERDTWEREAWVFGIRGVSHGFGCCIVYVPCLVQDKSLLALRIVMGWGISGPGPGPEITENGGYWRSSRSWVGLLDVRDVWRMRAKTSSCLFSSVCGH